MSTLSTSAAARNSGNDLSRSNSLVDLAARIKAEHVEAERSLRASVEHATRAGELLLEAKRNVGHGNWAEWLEHNMNFSDRLAQAYMRLARLPVEKRNAVADLPLREALSAIRSRQKLIADAEERMNQPPPGPAVVACVAEDGSVVVGAKAVLALPDPPVPPPEPPERADEIADDLVAQLHAAMAIVQDRIDIEDVRSAFDRRFGPSFETEECNPLIVAWDKAGSKHRQELVLKRKIEVLKAQQQNGQAAYSTRSPLDASEDDGLDIPDYLRRDAKKGGRCDVPPLPSPLSGH